VFLALLYAGAAYGIHRRVPVLWKLGWAVLLISSVEFTVGRIASPLTLPDGWVACVGILLAGIAITLYWGAWWNRQKDYFHSVGPEE